MAKRVLSFDTSSSLTAVAVCRGVEVLAQEAGPSAERHAQTLLPRVQRCLQQAGLGLSDIELVAVGIGPGSFTGVRVGLATAKGLALGSGVPVRGVVSLDAIARAVYDDLPDTRTSVVAAVLDAHKSEVFAALYARGIEGELQTLLAPLHGKPEVVSAQLTEAAGSRPLCVAGAGYRMYAAAMAACLPHARVLPDVYDAPSAAALAREALRAFEAEGASDLAALSPMYLRDSDAQLPKNPLRL
jgi:tRNA threonylcarbamoyladenosine biosynthesis protein TsaB